MNQGVTYEVKKFYPSTLEAHVRATRVAYFTKQRDGTNVEVQSVSQRRSFGQVSVAWGAVKVCVCVCVCNAWLCCRYTGM